MRTRAQRFDESYDFVAGDRANDDNMSQLNPPYAWIVMVAAASLPILLECSRDSLRFAMNK